MYKIYHPEIIRKCKIGAIVIKTPFNVDASKKEAIFTQVLEDFNKELVRESIGHILGFTVNAIDELCVVVKWCDEDEPVALHPGQLVFLE